MDYPEGRHEVVINGETWKIDVRRLQVQTHQRGNIDLLAVTAIDPSGKNVPLGNHESAQQAKKRVDDFINEQATS